MNKKILNLALPNIITNITVPLLGMVDLAIVGHIGDECLIGAIALGTMIFNLIYWNFGFLRIGTSGFTAQAYGAGNIAESLRVLVRALFIALVSAVLLIALQQPIALLSKTIVKSGDDVMNLALKYFYIRIWAAPATLGLYAIKGWFIGMQNAKYPMFVAIVLNVVNVLCSLAFAVGLKMGIAGVAIGTVVAQYSGLVMAVALWFKKYGTLYAEINLKSCLVFSEMKRFFSVNGDIFIRSICMIAVFTFIPAVSASMGNMVLAANTLLMQLFTLFSYVMDGFAYAGESLVGRFIGAKDKYSLKLSIKCLLRWGGLLTLIFTVAYFFFGRDILSLLTNDNNVIDAAMEFFVWSLVVPVAGFSAFLFDGIYVGAIASKSMRNVIVAATAAFFLAYFPLYRFLGNDGLWIAFLLFLVFRGGLMWLNMNKAVIKQVKD
ncbi:MAG: MATE family efflux transporter [Bacteroidales bacterium]|nr:MATE family efflux transporter [Bacteroidales bacterium]MDD2204552.1 MATE family efflux transporter [Bacteroidales bacterium]MDD3153100.1 MATE family efflux transporter [Bacteroidales bacterium]MDD3913493.1 MATE family efflux transporter [Bacteroidales bacterium]MDD4633982.1 MATE family efflux transporter [Bacteroidales bacterium]